MRLSFTVLCTTVLLAAPSRGASGQTAPNGACGDSLYLHLKQRPVDSLSTREYEIFRERDRACVQATASNQSTSGDAASMLEGERDGRALASTKGTGGWFGGGFASGFALGLIGTTIITVVAHNTDPRLPADRRADLLARGAVYSHSFEHSYQDKVRARRRNAALTGGLLGTVTIVAILVSNYD